MTNIFGKIGGIIGVIGVFLITFGNMSYLGGPNLVMMQVGLGFGIAAIVLGVLTILFSEYRKGVGFSVIMIGVLCIVYYFVYVSFFI